MDINAKFSMLNSDSGLGAGLSPPNVWINGNSAGSNVAATILNRKHIQLTLSEAMVFTEVDLNTTGSEREAGFSVLVDDVYFNIIKVVGTGTTTIDLYLYNAITTSSVVQLEYHRAGGDIQTVQAIYPEELNDAGFDGAFSTGDDVWVDVLSGSTIVASSLIMPATQIVQYAITDHVIGRQYEVNVYITSCSADFTVNVLNSSKTIDAVTYGSGGIWTFRYVATATTENLSISTVAGASIVLTQYSIKQFDYEDYQQSFKPLTLTNTVSQALATEVVAQPSEFSSSQLKMLIDGSLLNGAGKLYDSSPGGTAVLPYVAGAANQNGVIVLDSTTGRYSIQPTAGFWDYVNDIKFGPAASPDALDSGAWKSVYREAGNGLLIMNVGRYTDPDGSTELFDGKATMRGASNLVDTIAMSAAGDYHIYAVQASGANAVNSGVTGSQPATPAGADVYQTFKYQKEAGGGLTARGNYNTVTGNELSVEAVDVNSAHTLGTNTVADAGILYEGFITYVYFMFEFENGLPAGIVDDISWIADKASQGDIVFPPEWLNL